MELNQTSIKYYDKRLARLSVCTEASDSIVPDTFPDIGHVICAYGTAAVKDQTPQNGRLLVSGMVQATVLYQPEGGGGLRRLTVPITFAHIEECDGLDAEAVCFVCCRVASVDAVPVNSRKLSVSAQLCFEAEGYCSAACELTESIELPQIELKCSPQAVTLVEQVRTCPITVLEDVTMQDAAGMQLLHSICTMRASECRAMHGKVVLKGEAEVQCIALREDDTVRVLTSNTPFTQILEMPEAEEGDMIAAKLAVKEADCRLEADGLLSYTVSATALLLLRRARSVQQIDDLYLPGRALEMAEEQVMMHSLPAPITFAGETTETIQTVQRVSSVVAAGAVCCMAKRAAADALQMTAAVQVLYLDEERQLCAVQRTLPVSIPCAVPGALSQIELTARAAGAGENGMLLTLAASGAAAAEEHVAFRHITKLEAGKVHHAEDGVTLVLRYIEQEQPLWEIAKSCGTTMDAIRRANELPADAASVSKAMLLIPIQA